MSFRNLFVCLSAVLMMSLFSIVCIPLDFTPVPITLQSVICLVSGAILGGFYSALAMLVYLVFGVLGLPVFAGMHSGSSHILSASGGYIIGFIPYTLLTGIFVRRLYRINQPQLHQFAAIFVSMAASTVVFYFFSIFYFSIVTESSFLDSLALAVLPFIWVDLLKILVSAIAVMKLFQIAMFNDLL